MVLVWAVIYFQCYWTNNLLSHSVANNGSKFSHVGILVILEKYQESVHWSRIIGYTSVLGLIIGSIRPFEAFKNIKFSSNKDL